MCIIEDYYNREGEFKYMNMFELDTQIDAINQWLKASGRKQHVHPWQLEKLRHWQNVQENNHPDTEELEK